MGETRDDDIEKALAELYGKYREQPAWRRCYWAVMAWVWPFRWCSFSRSLVIEPPVGVVWSGMLGARRVQFGYPYGGMFRRFPIAARIRLGRAIVWTKVWEKGSESDPPAVRDA